MTPYVVTVITTGGFFAYLFRQEGAPPYMLSVLFRLALIAISFPPIYQLFKKRLIPAMEIQDDDVWKFSLPVPAMFSFISLFFLRNDYEQNGVLLAEFLGMLFIFSGCIFTCLLLLKALQRAKEKTEIAQQQKQISQLIGLQQEQYERLSQNIDYAKRARHDLRHHLSTIAGLFKENKLAELENYVEEYVGTLPPNTGLMVCENYAVNSLVSHYMARAHEEGIEVSVMLQIGNSGKISNTELCIIIGNCLENAIDGALTANEGERTIAIRGIVQHGNLIITVDNSYDGVIIEKEGRLMSRKRNGKAEGIGLVSVAAAVEKSNGQMKVEHEQSSFRVSLFLPM